MHQQWHHVTVDVALGSTTSNTPVVAALDSSMAVAFTQTAILNVAMPADTRQLSNDPYDALQLCFPTAAAQHSVLSLTI